MARSRCTTTVFTGPDAERAATRTVRFDRLHLDPKLREHLAKLDIHTVGDFLQLPIDGLSRRFGKAALELHRQASDAIPSPLDPTIPDDPLEAWIELEYPEFDAYRLTFAIQRVLPLLLQRVAARGHGLSGMSIALRLDDRSVITEEIRTANPTLEAEHVLELVRLKLESTKLDSGTVEIDLTVTTTAIDKGQLDLFTESGDPADRQTQSCEQRPQQPRRVRRIAADAPVPVPGGRLRDRHDWQVAPEV